MENVTKVGPIQSVVAQIKVIARNALRAELIAVRLTKIADLTGDVAHNNKILADLVQSTAIANYKISKLDAADPELIEKKAAQERNLKFAAEDTTRINACIVELNKSIAEQNKGIAAIEAGETKVDAEELNALTDKLINSNAKALADVVKPVATA